MKTIKNGMTQEYGKGASQKLEAYVEELLPVEEGLERRKDSVGNVRVNVL
jgi:hypothetical protein